MTEGQRERETESLAGSRCLSIPPSLCPSFLPLIAFDLDEWFSFIPEAYRRWVLIGLAVLIVWFVVQRVRYHVGRWLRRRHDPVIHPRLQRYNVDHAELLAQQREQAKKIVATSTGNRLAGYRIVRQIEAVYEDGHRTPEEAITALKAAAAERGANGLLNVTTERTAAGKCAASADAVQVAPLSARMPQRRPAPPTPPAAPPSDK